MKSKDNKGIFDYDVLKAFSYRGPNLAISEKYYRNPVYLIKEAQGIIG
jgi:hypothetical protein